MGGLERRLENLERLVEGRVEARVREELEAALDRLERHMTREEVIRVARILADEEEPQEGGGRWQA
jgi:hypothetical protein